MNVKNVDRNGAILKKGYSFLLALAVLVQLFILAKYLGSWGMQVFQMKYLHIA